MSDGKDERRRHDELVPHSRMPNGRSQFVALGHFSLHLYAATVS